MALGVVIKCIKDLCYTYKYAFFLKSELRFHEITISLTSVYSMFDRDEVRVWGGRVRGLYCDGVSLQQGGQQNRVRSDSAVLLMFMSYFTSYSASWIYKHMYICLSSYLTIVGKSLVFYVLKIWKVFHCKNQLMAQLKVPFAYSMSCVYEVSNWYLWNN